MPLDAAVASLFASARVGIRSILPIDEGIASRNFRVDAGKDGEYLARCELRRDVGCLAQDHDFAEAASTAGVSTPPPPFLMASVDGVPISVRKWISGQTLQARRSRLSERQIVALGEAIGSLHTASVSALPDRAYFYDMLLTVDAPRWETAFAAIAGHVWPEEVRHPLRQVVADAAKVRDLTSVRCLSPIGLIHGDLTPGNILFRPNAQITLLDWEKATTGPLLGDLAQAVVSIAFGRPNLCLEARCELLLAAYYCAKASKIKFDHLVAWLDAYSVALVLCDAMFAAQHYRTGSPHAPRRLKYLLDYCVPLFLRYRSRRDRFIDRLSRVLQ